MNYCGKQNTPEQSQSATILVVDDSRMNRVLLSTTLAKHGYQILEAADGRQALEVLGGHDQVELILLDLIMPEMDGFEFLEHHHQNLNLSSIPVIVNSSLDDFSSITRALKMGSYDYFTKPLSKENLEVTLPLKIGNAVNAHRLMKQAKEQNDLLQSELEMASLYQHFLLPLEPKPKGAEVALKFRPCSQVGGDYFDFIELSEEAWAMVVADVSGHGVTSAMIASMVKALLPGYLTQTMSPGSALEKLNSDLLRLTPGDSFVTAFAAVYQTGKRELTWSLAGHPAPVLFPATGKAISLSLKSPFLGVFESGHFENPYPDQTLSLAKGDRLALYTDGLIEAPNAQGSRYGFQRLVDFLTARRNDTLMQMRDALWHDLSNHIADDHEDDVVIILMEF